MLLFKNTAKVGDMMRETYNIEANSATCGVSLLVSILLRYPEVNTVKFDPDSNSLDFSFMISNTVEKEDFDAFQHEYISSIMAFWNLIRMFEASEAEIAYDIIASMTKIVVKRDISTLTAEEISLSMALVQRWFGDRLIKERESELSEEDRLTHEEFIRNLLADMNDTMFEKKLIGYREEGKVIVFNRTSGPNERH